jgi:hypothetical protein
MLKSLQNKLKQRRELMSLNEPKEFQMRNKR